MLKEFIASQINIRSSVAIIWNTIDYLEHSALSLLQQRFKVPFFTIGPLHKMAAATSTSFLEEDQSCIAFLEKQAPNSVLYISLGSIACIDEKELTETAWGLANSSIPFLWVIRSDSINGSQLFDQFPEGSFKAFAGERGLIVKWAPQRKVLAHRAVGGFWSHCGWNSTVESICEGVPMICRPHFGDQLVNARYLTCVWKVGLEMENVLDRGSIERTIRRLMVDIEGKEMRQRMLVFKDKVESGLQKGGSSYESLNDLTDFITSYSAAAT